MNLLISVWISFFKTFSFPIVRAEATIPVNLSTTACNIEHYSFGQFTYQYYYAQTFLLLILKIMLDLT